MGVTVEELDNAFNLCQIGDWFVTNGISFCWKLNDKEAWWSHDKSRVSDLIRAGYSGWSWEYSETRTRVPGLQISPLLQTKAIEDDLLWE